MHDRKSLTKMAMYFSNMGDTCKWRTCRVSYRVYRLMSEMISDVGRLSTQGFYVMLCFMFCRVCLVFLKI